MTKNGARADNPIVPTVRSPLGTVVGSLGQVSVSAASMAAGAFVGFQTALRIACHSRPMPTPHQLSNLLEHPLRLGYRDPAELINQCGIASGETVVDLGCGIGTFTIEMARQVGPQGKVHALDFQLPMLAQLDQRMAQLSLTQRVQPHLANAQNIPLPDGSADAAFLIATLGQIADPVVAIDEIHRILKPGGRLIVSEELPDPGYVSSQTCRRWMLDAGFEFTSHQSNLLAYVQLYIRP